MTRTEIIKELRNYFSIQELVCPHTFKRFGETAWQFLSTPYLHTLLVVRRDILKVSMTCNNYSSGGVFTQRGNRCNLCQMVRDKTAAGSIYMSAHVLCQGGDFSSDQMGAEMMRQTIKKNKELLPYNIRIERTVNWLHMDVYDTGEKVFEFNG